MGWEPLGMGLQNARSNCAGMPGRPPVGMAQPLCADFTPCEETRRAPAKCSGAAPGLARPGSGMGRKGTAQGVLMPQTLRMKHYLLISHPVTDTFQKRNRKMHRLERPG